MTRKSHLVRLMVLAALLLAAAPVAAYIGPGSGISLLGGLWSVLVGVVLALAAILFWPVRLMIKRMRRKKAAVGEPSSGRADTDSLDPPR